MHGHNPRVVFDVESICHIIVNETNLKAWTRDPGIVDPDAVFCFAEREHDDWFVGLVSDVVDGLAPCFWAKRRIEDQPQFAALTINVHWANRAQVQVQDEVHRALVHGQEAFVFHFFGNGLASLGHVLLDGLVLSMGQVRVEVCIGRLTFFAIGRGLVGRVCFGSVDTCALG